MTEDPAAASTGVNSDALPDGPLLFYDGGCALCHRAVRLLLRWERPGSLPGSVLRFATLDGTLADCLRADGTLPLERDAVTFVADGDVTQAEAAIRSALRAVGRPGLAAFLGLWPTPLRHWGYRTVAANRTRWFGRTEAACPLPKDSQRFLL